MNRLQFLLVKLAEEASEISQIALKTAQFGMDETCPGLEVDNRGRIHEELNDLNAIVMLLNCEFNFNYVPSKEARNKKIEKLSEFYNYSKELGLVRDCEE